MSARTATVTRKTSETSIELTLVLDGTGQTSVSTGYGFLDHMLDLLAHWAGFDLTLSCTGDLHVDAHHTAEDVALCLGEALLTALGERTGIGRTASARVPMDEAIADVAVDLSGRAYCVCRGMELLPIVVAGQEKDLWREVFKSLANGGRMNLHVEFRYGENGHHLLESAMKGLGLCLKEAVAQTGKDGVLSTKGSLD